MVDPILESLLGFQAAGFVILSLVLGIFIIIKYFEHKKTELLFVGLTWIGIASMFWGYAFNYLTTQFLGFNFDEHLYFFFATGTIAMIHITWMIPFTEFLYKSKQKLIMLIILIESALYEIIYFTLFTSNLSQIGTQISLYYVSWSFFVKSYILITLILLFITGIIFASKSVKSENKDIQLKGKILMIAFISFTIPIFLEIAFILPEEIILITRTIIGSAAIEFYLGFILPNWFKKRFIKDKTEKIQTE